MLKWYGPQIAPTIVVGAWGVGGRVRETRTKVNRKSITLPLFCMRALSTLTFTMSRAESGYCGARSPSQQLAVVTGGFNTQDLFIVTGDGAIARSVGPPTVGDSTSSQSLVSNSDNSSSSSDNSGFYALCIVIGGMCALYHNANNCKTFIFDCD